jgi:hypothetical protein
VLLQALRVYERTELFQIILTDQLGIRIQNPAGGEGRGGESADRPVKGSVPRGGSGLMAR